jgi:HSP20 family protein
MREKGKEVLAMAIIRWTPLRHVMSFRDEMDKMLSDLYGRMSPSGEYYEGEWFPAMDIKENKDDVVACLELPGIDKDQIKVSVQNDMLIISGEKKQESVEDGENLHRVERTYGYFKRTVGLPAEVDAAKVKATYKDGILKVTLPKREEKKPKEITVQVA